MGKFENRHTCRGRSLGSQQLGNREILNNVAFRRDCFLFQNESQRSPIERHIRLSGRSKLSAQREMRRLGGR